jgi:hypothetical protein
MKTLLARGSNSRHTPRLLSRIAGLGLVLLLTASFAPTQILCEGFVPPNDLKIPVGMRMKIMGLPETGGIDEVTFNSVIDKVINLYKDEVSAKGGKFQINRLWTDATVNANAERQADNWILNMYGGLARHPAITRDGFALVVCHETGHQLGGAPKFMSWFGVTDWAADEGEADYYSTLKCLRRFFSDEDNTAELAKMTVDPIAQGECQKQYGNTPETLLCVRSIMAGKSVSALFKSLRKETKDPDLTTPDPAVVEQTDDNHPATQCRLDTYYHGALCNVPVTEALSDTDYHQGSCTEMSKAPLGLRPTCWFHAI